jgi:hypothetical protein
MPRMSQAEYCDYLARREYRKPLCLAGRERIAAVKTEAELHDWIMAECRRRGWIALHGRMDAATGRTVGEPDFVILADAGRVVLLECKTATGKLRPEQAALHAWASKLGHTVHVVRSLAEAVEMLNKPI